MRLSQRISRIDGEHVTMRSSVFRHTKPEEPLSSGESEVDDAFMETDMGEKWSIQ